MNNILIEPKRKSEGVCLADSRGVLIIHLVRFDRERDEGVGTRHLYAVRENAEQWTDDERVKDRSDPTTTRRSSLRSSDRIESMSNFGVAFHQLLQRIHYPGINQYEPYNFDWFVYQPGLEPFLTWLSTQISDENILTEDELTR